MRTRTPLLGRLLRNQTPVPYTSRSRVGPLTRLFTSSGGAEEQMKAYGSVGTLFAIVSGIAEAEMQVRWRLYRRAPSGLPEDREEVTDHPALDLWRRPNPFYSQEEFVEATAQHRELTGEEWWIIVRSQIARGMPLEMWPVRPDRMRPVPDPEQFISHYEYLGPDGEVIRLERDEVIQVKLPNPLDPYRGMGRVQALLADIDSARYSAEWNRNFFLNGAEPGGVIESDERLSEPEYEEFLARWREQHQGVANAHRVALLEKMRWVERKFSMRDMQFVELRQISSEMIREAFRFPKPMLGTVEDVNRANAEAAEVFFARWLLTPRAERRKGVLNTRFLPMFGPREAEVHEFDFDPVIPEDSETINADRDSRVRAADVLIRVGFSPDEVRHAMGLPEMTYIGTRSSTTPDPEGFTPPEDGETNLARPQLPAGRPSPFDPAGGPDHAHHHPRRIHARDEEEERRVREAEKQLTEVQAQWEYHLGRLLGDWESILVDQRAELREQIMDAVDRGDLNALSQLTVSSQRGAALLTEAMVVVAALSASLMSEEADRQGVHVDPAEPDRDELAVIAAAVAALLASSLAVAAGQEALRLARQGAAGAEVAAGVDRHLAGLSDRYLRDHLGGALSTAQNHGRIGTLRSAPVAAYYASEVNDSRRCGPCSEVDGRWLGNDLEMVLRSYPAGGYVLCEGRERCRGTVVAVWRPEQVPDAV